MSIARRTNRLISTKTSNGINKENIPANLKFELKTPIRNNSPIIIAKDKNMNKPTLTEEANEILKSLPSSIKQEICTMSSYTVLKTS